VTKDTKWFRMLDEAWVGLDTQPPAVMRVQVSANAADLLKRESFELNGSRRWSVY
jgi:hypothetical protein